MADPLRFDVEVSPEATRQMAGQASMVFRAMAAGIVTEMRRLMSLPKTGRAYRRGLRAIHIASAPGQAPAVDREGLTNSINFQMQGELQATVTVNAEYAAYLEIGTRHMAARPYARPAIDKVRDQFKGILGETRLRMNR